MFIHFPSHLDINKLAYESADFMPTTVPDTDDNKLH